MLNRNSKRVPAISEAHAAAAAASGAANSVVSPTFFLPVTAAVTVPTTTQAVQSIAVNPFFLDRNEVNRYRLSVLNSLEKIRFTLEEDFKKLDAATKNENAVCNRMFSSILDTFFTLLEENLATLKRRYAIDIDLEGTKQMMQAEAKNFDHQLVSQFANNRRQISNSVINFYTTDFSLLFKVQASFLTPHLIDDKLSFQYDQMVRNLLAEQINMANALNAVITRKMDYSLHTALNFKTYLCTSLSVSMNDHREFTASELAINDIFNDLVHRIQKLKVVTVLNVNNLFSKNYDKDQRMVHLELLKLKDLVFGVNGAQLLQQQQSNGGTSAFTGFLSNFFVHENFDAMLKQPNIIDNQVTNFNTFNSGISYFVLIF
jgi:hypothetical protein